MADIVAGLAIVVTLASWAGAMLALPVALYLGVLTLLSWRTRPPCPGAPLRLVCVVPAHNEAEGIAATVASLHAASYPADLRRVIVVADNCDDATASCARAAGAWVVERSDPHRRGKGYALEVGFAWALEDVAVDGILVVDADTVVAPNLWQAVSAHLAAGAAAVQVANVVRNPKAGWRPALQAIGMALVNGVRSLGRERLGLSVGLRGTGMAFARSTLERVPHRVYGMVEDVEYGVRLGLAGLRVAYAAETWIASDAPVSAEAALSQRRRWEGGRAALVRTMLPRVARAALQSRSAVLADLALDLVVPPLSYPALLVATGGGLEALHTMLAGAPSSAAPLWIVSAGVLASHVLRGVVLSGAGLPGIGALLRSPTYIAWKLFVARPWRATDAWVRTQRAGEAPRGGTRAAR